MRLSRVILFARDLPEMLAFYRDTLGLRPLSGEARSGWVELDAGGATVGLHAIPGEIAAQISVSLPPRAREDTPIKLTFAVRDVAAERSRLVSQGVVMREVQAWGACDGLDPEGNVFQLVEERPPGDRMSQ